MFGMKMVDLIKLNTNAEPTRKVSPPSSERFTKYPSPDRIPVQHQDFARKTGKEDPTVVV